MNLKKLQFGIHLPGLSKNNSGKRYKHSKDSAEPQQYINPRFRAYGKARLDIANRVQSQADWDTLWKEPVNPFALSFPWGSVWKQCIEYYVADFAAEVGFWIDIFGLPVIALGPDYAQFISPGGEISIAVSPASPENPETPRYAIRLQFLIENIDETVSVLESRNVNIFPPQQLITDSNIYSATFSTPHGIKVDLWCEKQETQPHRQPIPDLETEEIIKPEPEIDHWEVSPSDEVIQEDEQPDQHDMLLESLSFLAKPGNQLWEDFDEEDPQEVDPEGPVKPLTLADFGLGPVASKINNTSPSYSVTDLNDSDKDKFINNNDKNELDEDEEEDEVDDDEDQILDNEFIMEGDDQYDDEYEDEDSLTFDEVEEESFESPKPKYRARYLD